MPAVQSAERHKNLIPAGGLRHSFGWLVGWYFFFYITDQTGKSTLYYDGDVLEERRKELNIYMIVCK